MQFTKIFSIIALAATGAHALPEPKPLTPVSVNGTFSAFSDAATTVIVGAQAMGASDVAQIQSLVATVVASAKSDVDAAAAAIAVIVGEGQLYADALANILTTFTACIAASA